MRYRFHKFIAEMAGWGKVLKNIFHINKSAKANDFSKSFHITLLRRVGQSHYFDKVSIKQPCGCYGIDEHLTSILGSCDEHGIRTLREKRSPEESGS